MLKGSSTQLLDLRVEQVSNWLQSFDTVLSDCDGTIWHHDTAIEGAAEVLNLLQKRHNKKVYLITNNGLKTRRELFEQAKHLGFHLPNEHHIISPTSTIVDYLEQDKHFDTKKHKVYVVGNAAIARELKSHNIDSFRAGERDELSPNDKWQDFALREFTKEESNANVGAVIVGWDEHFSYCKMARACHILSSNKNAAFLVTNRDAVHKYPKFNIPGTGAFVSGIEACAGFDALEMGKPNPLVLESFIKNKDLIPERTLMIGDCLKIDISFARNCNMHSLLVGTGSYQLNTLEQYRDLAQPDVYLPKLADLLSYL